MKSTRSIIFTAVLAIITSTSMVAQSNSWSEQWYRAKFGRPSPTEEARIQAAQQNTAYREVKPVQTVVPANTWFEGWYRAKYGRPSPTEEARLNAAKQTTSEPAVIAPNNLAAPTNDQRVALAKCMKATEQVRIHASEMRAMGRPWGRGRIGYSKNDLVILSDHRDELRLALSKLAAVHQEFLKGLSEAQEQRLEQRLRKLDQLQAELNVRISEIDRDLLKAEPGPDSSGISWDVDGIQRAADKWRSQHRKIEKEMGIGPDQSSINQSLRSTQYDLSYARHTGKE